jgi:hypothetical protein
MRKVARGRESKVDSYLLLRLIADDYLNGAGAETTTHMRDSEPWLKHLNSLNDPRGVGAA